MSPSITKSLLPALCTIFAVAQDAEHTYWGTAAHCAPPVGQIMVIASPDGSGRPIEARVIERDQANDTAILKAWTKEVGPVKCTNTDHPANDAARITSHRGDIPAIVQPGSIDIAGHTPRRLATAMIMPGDSGSPVIQRDKIVGVVSHKVGNCESGFCPAEPKPQGLGRLIGGLADETISPKPADPWTITLRDIGIAVAAAYAMNRYAASRQNQ